MTLELAAPHRLWRFALAGLILPASLVVALLVGLLIGNANQDSDALQAVGVVVTFTLLLAGNALWARTFARIAGVGHARRFIFVAAIAQLVVTLASVLALGKVEEHFVVDGNTTLPLHVLYTLLFVPATFICAFIVGVVCGVALGKRSSAWRMGLHGATAAALAFLALNVLQDMLGRRVGGPNAAATATMITVTLVCHAAASMAFSTALGRRMLSEESQP